MRRTIIAVLAVLTLAGAPALASAAHGPLPSGSFEPSDACGCHGELVFQWTGSMHSKALSDPIYLAKVADADAATDGKLSPFCHSCHGPAATLTGEIHSTDATGLSAAGAEGVSCDYCHQVTGAREVENAKHTVRADGVKRAQLKDANSPGHRTAYSAFHESAAFCGTCHNVDHPGNGMHLEATYTEWKNSPYAASGTTCQDCHMTPGPGETNPNPGKAAGSGPQRPHIFSMTFAGGNFLLGERTFSEMMLRGAATIEVTAPEFRAKGETGTVAVRIDNVGAGHYLPTGLTEVREMWLEVVAIDTAGHEVLREVRRFGTELEDASGNHPVELWDATAIHSDDRIPPKGSAESSWTFVMPEDGVLNVTARLLYRSAPEPLLRRVKLDVTPFEMAAAGAHVFTSAEDRRRHLGEAWAPKEEASGPPVALMALTGLAVVAAGAGGAYAVRRRARS